MGGFNAARAKFYVPIPAPSVTFSFAASHQPVHNVELIGQYAEKLTYTTKDTVP